MILDNIKEAKDIKKISPKEYPALAKEIREFLITKISKTGGHLASNLGVVELTMALYLNFDLPKDKVIWDVGHQSYTHKILSGRKDCFDGLRTYGGMAGFPKVSESDCDAFNTGHSSTSISAGLGLAQAAYIKGEKNYIVSVIGDGALTGGMAYEALNNAVALKRNFIIILNDNNMSISQNVGGISQYLDAIRTGEVYHHLKRSVMDGLSKVPIFGGRIIDSIRQAKNGIKQILIPGMFFENMGITYLGPVDGHDIKKLSKVLNEAKSLDSAVLIHVITKKGKGYAPAEKEPDRFHGVSSFDIATGQAKSAKKAKDYSAVFSDTMLRLAKQDKDVVAITAAMPEGTGLTDFAKEFPKRFFDVGIAEQHAVTSAAGMAAGGLKPVVAVYSSFLQRAYDQIVHDVCLQNLPVIFAIDRAGLVGADGETHQGIFDISYMSCIPNMTVFAPKNAWELDKAFDFALKLQAPIAIRYPRGAAYQGLAEFTTEIVHGKAEPIYIEEDIALLALGTMVSTAEHLRDRLKAEGRSVSLINMRFAKPIDTDILDVLARTHTHIITMEENVLRGGFGLEVSDYIASKYPAIKMKHISIPDAYVEHGEVSILRESIGIDSASIWESMQEFLHPIQEGPALRKQRE